MSCYNRLKGTITLPTAEVAGVKRQVRAAHNDFVEKVYAAAKDWWRANKTQSVKRYNASMEATARRVYENRRGLDRHSESVVFASALQDVLSRIYWQARGPNGANLRGVTWADMEAEGMGRVTSRTNSFGRADGYIGFDGRTLTVSVEENNRAVERWESQPSAVALVDALNNVNWTRGSGGVIMYDDEYNRDAMMGPSEYLVYGPDTDHGMRTQDSAHFIQW